MKYDKDPISQIFSHLLVESHNEKKRGMSISAPDTMDTYIEEKLACFRAEGFVVIEGALDAALCDELDAAIGEKNNVLLDSLLVGPSSLCLVW